MMISKGSYIILLWSVIILFFPNWANSMDLKGNLLYSQGTSVISLNLERMTKEEIARFQGHISIPYLTGDKNFVVVSNNGVLTMVDINTKKQKTIIKGIRPTLLNKDNLFFYQQDEKDTSKIWLSHLNLSTLRRKEIISFELKSVHKKHRPYPTVKINSDSVLFLSDDLHLWIYEVSTDRLIKTKISDCIPYDYIPHTKQIVCEAFSDERMYHLTSLESGESSLLPITKHDIPLTYNYDQNILFIKSVRWKFPFGEKYPIYYYDFATDKTIKILDDEFIGGAVWLME